MEQNQASSQTTEQQPETEPQQTPPESGVSDSGAPETPQEPLSDEDLFASLDEEDEPEPEGDGGDGGDPDGDPEADEDDGEGEPEGGPEGEQEGADGDSKGKPDGRPEGEAEGDAGKGGEFDKAERPPETGVDQEPEWFKSLPDDVRSGLVEQNKYTQYLYQSYQALQGRLAPVQRENADLRERLRKHEQAPTPTLEDLEKNDAYKEIAEEFPEEAKSLKGVFASKERESQQVKQQAQQLKQALDEQRQQTTQRELQRLESQHPDWMNVTNSQPFQQWKSVVEANPQMYPEMANKLSSPWAEDNVDVLNQFKKDYAEYTGNGQQPPAQNSQQPQQQQRPQQKPNRPRPPQPSPPSQSSGISGNRGHGTPLSDEDLFEKLVEQDG